MSKNENPLPIRTIVLAVIVVPLVAYLLYFAYKKNSESEAKANQCQTECSEKGYNGYDFKWTILAGPKCGCFDA